MDLVRDEKDLARLKAEEEQYFTVNGGFNLRSLQFVSKDIRDETCDGISDVMKSADLGSVFLKGGLGGHQVIRGLRSEESIDMSTLMTCRVRDLLSLNYHPSLFYITTKGYLEPKARYEHRDRNDKSWKGGRPDK